MHNGSAAAFIIFVEVYLSVCVKNGVYVFAVIVCGAERQVIPKNGEKNIDRYRGNHVKFKIRNHVCG